MLFSGADEALFGSMRNVHAYSETTTYSELCVLPPWHIRLFPTIEICVAHYCLTERRFLFLVTLRRFLKRPRISSLDRSSMRRLSVLVKSLDMNRDKEPDWLSRVEESRSTLHLLSVTVVVW